MAVSPISFSKYSSLKINKTSAKSKGHDVQKFFNYNNNFKSTSIADQLVEYSINDGQVNNSGKISNFTDFQNVALSNLSFFELFYKNDKSIEGKTIKELFEESLGSSNYNVDDYVNFELDMDKCVSLVEKESSQKYLNLFLGKLVTYGFGDMRVKEIVSGPDGFDAVVLEDKDGNNLIYYSCTDVHEIEDYLFDTYPILDTLGDMGTTGATVSGAKSIHDSQLEQAVKLRDKYLNENKTGKVNIGGFSLGGSSAETAFFTSDADNLGDLILYNPYHAQIDKNLVDNAAKNNKLKIYATEGDAVSTINNYDTFSEYTKAIYIGYKDVIVEGKERAASDNNLMNVIATNVKNKYLHINDTIDSCDVVMNKVEEIIPSNMPWLKSVVNAPIKAVKNVATDFKNAKVDAQGFISTIESLNDQMQNTFNNLKVPVIKQKSYGNAITLGYNIDFQSIDISKYDMKFVKAFHNLEVLLAGVHMPYYAEVNKGISFDSNGNVVSIVNGNDVEYPPFDDIAKEIFGSNALEDLQDFVANLF